MAMPRKNRSRETTLKLERIQTCYQQVIFSKYGKDKIGNNSAIGDFTHLEHQEEFIGDDVVWVHTYLFTQKKIILMTLQNLLENKEFSSKGIILGITHLGWSKVTFLDVF
jgi:hypothetical protein